MPKTQGELIREHGDLIVALQERVEHLRRDADRLESRLYEIAGSRAGLESRIGLIESWRELSKKTAEERDRKSWMLLMAAVGSVLTLVVNLILIAIRK